MKVSYSYIALLPGWKFPVPCSIFFERLSVSAAIILLQRFFLYDLIILSPQFFKYKYKVCELSVVADEAVLVKK